MRNNMKTFAKFKSSHGLIASRRAFHAKTSARWGDVKKEKDLRANDPVCFSKSFASCRHLSPLGWCLRTCRTSSLLMLARTLKQWSGRLPNAGIWDFGACLMLGISECPKIAAAGSWSRVLDATPPSSSYLTRKQWRQYLARLSRSRSHGARWGSLPILKQRQTQRGESILVQRFSCVKKTEGIRWLSGKEALAYMGFPRDWIAKTGLKVTRRAMQLSLHAHNTSRKS